LGKPLHVCLEATGVYGYRAAMTLAACPETEVSVVNPAQIAAFAKAQRGGCGKSDNCLRWI
jgi:transposase